MTLREKLLKNTPKLTAIEINGEKYFVREFTVGEMNHALYGQQQELIKLAQKQGIELNFNDEEELTKQLSQVYDPYRLARSLATRLCDENGNNIFDVENQDDLNALSKLDKATFEQFSKALADIAPKNSTTGADSN
ncbi:hypothetical protein CBG46_09905 [Actinobacillus succinogenes]|uniref:Phage protein n=1 Tax=Actinobacillus succinogenes (strain ATCC 55618 / DSM 22257 / CCUG 43843 / 130Z) TaxID=339671 RepID=A6VNQ9_ACTSZ|nr:hypothetical protein [Actinobacillus succinogenes]ABR74606.1 hypothetical protein Asuc_1246 [Actinobacillus succinogenes 130Z]PHI40968.1 hypothetical protein CBG46_09905 [Actinobacillus succinogenes]